MQLKRTLHLCAILLMILASHSTLATTKFNCQDKLLTTPIPLHSSINNTSEPEWIVLSAAYSTSSAYVPMLRELIGHEAMKQLRFLHVKPEGEIDVSYSKTYRNQDFDHQVTGLQEALDFLKGKKVRAAFNGLDAAAHLTDAIREAFHIPGNGTELTTARRNKLIMQEQLEKEGVRFIPSLLSGDIEQIKEWIKNPKTNQNNWPVVVKPVDSASAQGFRLCENIEQVIDAVEYIKKTPNVYGVMSDKAIVQRYQSGVEYAVNTVSSGDLILITDIWRYKKTELPGDSQHGSQRVYDFDTLIDLRSDEAKPLIEYVKKSLHALGVRHGAAHSEIMMTERESETEPGKTEIVPVLIEMAPRLMGGRTDIGLTPATGTNSMELTLLEALRPDLFREFIEQHPDGIIPTLQVRMIQFISRHEGKVKNVHPEIFQDLLSVYKINPSLSAGDQLRKTTDLVTSPGSIWLIHADPEQLAHDIEQIRQREAKLYELEE